MLESSRPAYTGLKDSVSEKENNSKEKKIPPLHSQLYVGLPRMGGWEAALTLCLAHGDSALYPNVGAARRRSSVLLLRTTLTHQDQRVTPSYREVGNSAQLVVCLWCIESKLV